MKKGLTKVIILILAAVLTAAAAVGTVYVCENYVLVNGVFYPKNQTVLDLQAEEISCDTFEKLDRRLPGCTILWNVPFQDGYYPNYTEEITISELTDEDVARLDYFPQLKKIHAETCRDYDQLLALYQRRKDCEVSYQVNIGGRAYPQNSKKVLAPELTEEDAARLCYLPQLQELDATGCLDYPLLMKLEQEHPEWKITYSILIGGQEYDMGLTDLSAENASYEELVGALTVMKELKTITLTNPKATGEELIQLRKDYPNVTIRWNLQVLDRLISDDVEEVDISNLKLKDVSEAEQIAGYFPNITKLIMSDCGIDDETMAAFREEKRSEYKVVWTVYMTKKCKARTDDTMFMPIKQLEWYFQDDDSGPLKYCEDMIAIDLGHSRVRDISFVAYMPHLKYLILADTDVRDLTPLSNCKELVWLEIGWCAIESYEPLVECTALEDLNLGRTFADPEPISRMTWLKNLWCMERSSAVQYNWRQALPDTRIVGVGNDVVAYGWRKLPNYYKMRDALGMPYMA